MSRLIQSIREGHPARTRVLVLGAMVLAIALAGAGLLMQRSGTASAFVSYLSSSGDASYCKYGDLDGDRRVTSRDTALLLQLNAGLIDDLRCEEEADGNGDGNADSSDGLLILEFAAGLVTGFGPGGSSGTSTFVTDTPTETPVTPTITSTPTPTDTPVTPTATSTPPEGEEAIQCYTILDRTRPRFERTERYLNDQWTDASFRVQRPKLFCTPAEKFDFSQSFGQGSIASAPDYPQLNCYDIRRAPHHSSFQRRIELVANQFGEQLLRVTHEEMLCVGAFKLPIKEAESATAATPPERFWKCYRVKELNTPREESRVIFDQFGEREIIVEEVIRFCNNVNKFDLSGQGAGFPPSIQDTLICFDTSDADDQERLSRQTILVDDQFGTLTLRMVRPYALCVPSDKLSDPP